MFGQALQAHQGLGWLAMLGVGTRGAVPSLGAGERRRRRELRAGRAERATILFADICGSTPLYQAAGDRQALRVVSECIDTLAVIASECGGRIVRSKGDDLLCTFDDAEAALVAGRRMVEARRKTEARVRVALHHGALIRARGDIFGDAVNLAARVLGLGKADEVLATGAAYAQLRARDRTTLRRLGEHRLRGARDPVSLYAALPAEGADSTTLRNAGTNTLSLDDGRREAPGAATLRVECGAEHRRCTDGESLLVGRAPSCDVVVPLSWVSREHATLSMSGGRLTLEDHSSTGTHVRLADGHEFFVRRETIVLSGGGVITPGGRRSEDGSFTVRFAVEREQ